MAVMTAAARGTIIVCRKDSRTLVKAFYETSCKTSDGSVFLTMLCTLTYAFDSHLMYGVLMNSIKYFKHLVTHLEATFSETV